MILCRSCGNPNSTLEEICPKCGLSIYSSDPHAEPQPRTLSQNSQLHVLLSQTLMTPYKQRLVQNFTDQRATSSKDMYFHECHNLIKYLKELGPIITPKDKSKAKMRAKISAICHDIGWKKTYGKRADSVDKERVNRFLMKYGIVKKKFYDLNNKDLVVTIHQFEQLKEYQFNNV